MRTEKVGKIVVLGVILLLCVPEIADARGAFGGASNMGFGPGLFNGLAFAPGPAYAGPPGSYPPAPPVPYPYDPYYVSAPVPPDPQAYSYSNQANVSSGDGNVSFANDDPAEQRLGE